MPNIPSLTENEVQTMATIVGTLLRDGLLNERDCAIAGGKIFTELRWRGLITPDPEQDAKAPATDSLGIPLDL